MGIINVLTLLLEALLVHEVVLGGADVRVGSDDEATAGLVDVLVHDHDIVLVEGLVVELSVLIVLGILTVEPEDINGEAEVGEVVVSLRDLLGRVLLPLGEVVTKRVYRRHGGVSSELRKLLLELLGVGLSTHQVELESITLRDEGRVALGALVGVVEEDEGFSRVHPGNGSIHVRGMTHDVGDGSVERLIVSALLLELLSVLVEESVRVVKASLL